jgi:hypothetical protein
VLSIFFTFIFVWLCPIRKFLLPQTDSIIPRQSNAIVIVPMKKQRSMMELFVQMCSPTLQMLHA